MGEPSHPDVSDARLKAYVAGRLPAAEAAALERAAAADPELAAEIALVRGMVGAGALALPEADAAFGWARLSKAIGREPRASPPGWLRARVPAWQAAAAVLGGVAVWQLAAVPQLASRDEPGYQVASETPAAAHSAQVTFRPDATETAIRAALLEVGGEFRGGPSALGVYQVGFKDEAARTAGLEALRANTDVVESAEPE